MAWHLAKPAGQVSAYASPSATSSSATGPGVATFAQDVPPFVVSHSSGSKAYPSRALAKRNCVTSLRAHRRARDAGEAGPAVGGADDGAAGPRTGETASGPEHPPLVEADRCERGRLEVPPVSRLPRGRSRSQAVVGHVEPSGEVLAVTGRLLAVRRGRTGAVEAGGTRKTTTATRTTSPDTAFRRRRANRRRLVPLSIALVGSSTCARPAGTTGRFLEELIDVARALRPSLSPPGH